MTQFLWLIYSMSFTICWLVLDYFLDGMSVFGWHYNLVNIGAVWFVSWLSSNYCLKMALVREKFFRGFLIGVVISLSGLFLSGFIFGVIGLWVNFDGYGFSLGLLDGALWTSLMNMIFAFITSPVTLAIGGVSGVIYFKAINYLVINDEPVYGRKRFVSQQIFVLSISAAVVWYSLLIPTRVESRKELQEIKFGHPISYVIQNQSKYSFGYSPESPDFPVRVSPASPWENGTKAMALPFMMNVLIVYSIALVALGLKARRSSKKT